HSASRYAWLTDRELGTGQDLAQDPMQVLNAMKDKVLSAFANSEVPNFKLEHMLVQNSIDHASLTRVNHLSCVGEQLRLVVPNEIKSQTSVWKFIIPGRSFLLKIAALCLLGVWGLGNEGVFAQTSDCTPPASNGSGNDWSEECYLTSN